MSRVCSSLVMSAPSRGRSFRLLTLIGLLASVATIGCGKSDGKVTVHGHVNFRGQPLERASLTFFPATGRSEAAGVEDGEYSVALAPGEYTVVALVGVELPPGYKEGDKVPPPKVVLPEEYTSRVKSTLKASVSGGQSEPVNFELK